MLLRNATPAVGKSTSSLFFPSDTAEAPKLWSGAYQFGPVQEGGGCWAVIAGGAEKPPKTPAETATGPQH